MRALGDLHAGVPVIVQTSEAATHHAIDAMRAGAFEFLVKPCSLERIAAAIDSALKFTRSGSQGRPVRRARTGAVGFGDIVAASAAMARAVELGRRAAQSLIPVMLEGEAGVGKEMMARAIHAASERSARPFVIVNCAAIPHGLIEGVLFGRDASGLVSGEIKGKFAEAEGGTLFIEEVSELPLPVQTKLLSLVQGGEMETVAGKRPRKVNVRLIMATNKDLIEEVKAGRFREDLYYRLNVFPVTMPSLRRRKEDIPHLARAFVARFSAEQRLVKPLAIDAAALALLTGYDWPGNTRQLENAVFRAVVLAEGAVLGERDFPQILSQVQSAWPSSDAVGTRPVFTGAQPPAAIAPEAAPAPAPLGETASADRGAPVIDTSANVIISTDEAGNVRKLAEIEEELIRFALKFYRGQMSQVARKLGIGRSTLYRKLKDYGIDPDDPQKHAA
ncbi:sigma-54-dependent Fis family transcriptional regulator [Ciceribacter naphthalenivorans]|uniref:DNA-binding transcriptional regulator NtrC n=3 Tax=Pseudomonadota TaxID=1224 RepID=A0A512HKV4_9HYPH|nr:sigma-54-dependent Fis family transcriptional regulator [Ciceribacter naphthalenivorans]GLR22173.1 sigma-54-dependent Fis family transcriptional regulator [Ciceribacter naphthalenivorans]GLT05029.1 sigma-54-dependent Fis family transcriptional regulator [Sphingomonas psychrolutea]